tara:strand:- start:369 stop:533 length:165 start_codon:yes stop_codon:yes gene_type:complete
MAESLRGLISPASNMDLLELLDYYTAITLEAYWRQLVKEAQEANNTTGKTEDTD